LPKKLHIAYHPIYAHPLPEGHRFPMLKYELIPGQLLYEGSIENSNLFEPEPCDDTIILLTHTADYLNKIKNLLFTQREQRVIGFPQSAALMQRELIITQGTIDCCFKAIENGVALNVAGGTHHAFADKGEGFCILNDMACAANYLLAKNMANKILIVDLDVHQGNGTAKLFEQNANVFTFSMHGAHNYPFHKEKSTRDIPLPDGISDLQYLELLKNNLTEIVQHFKPDFCFYLSGVDILSTDQFGKLNITMDGCKQRDVFVLQTMFTNKIATVVAMGGGYSKDVKLIVQAHCNTFRVANQIFY
jgi:acetoin utilization deacetylase AcuC-like enzyme